MKSLRLALAFAPLAVAASASALTFNLNYTAGTSAAAQTSFQNAANRWATLFSDNMTVNLTVGLGSLGPNVLGSTNAAQVAQSYNNVRVGLVNDRTSSDDYFAVAGLQAGPNLTVSTNYFADNPNANRATPFNTTITTLAVSRANAKAIGLVAGNDATSDGTILFASSGFSFDYDPTDGIGGSSIDFTGIATHEIGHALGFYSGVDYVDSLSSSTTDTSGLFAFGTPWDLYRRSGVSNNPDWTAGNVAKFASVDNGAFSQGALALGVSRGDNAQASHWKDNLGLGIMDPTAANGELLAISARDVRAFDLMGYNLKSVPEPATFAVLGLGAAALLRRRKKA